MPYARFPSCFLSCSFDPDDRAIFDWFRKILDALEFQVLSGEEPTTRSLPEMARERIESSEAFVGVLTRRDKVEGSNEWLPPTWVRDEVSIAYSLGKPVAIFAEEGVRVDGILPQVTKYERWSRQDLGGSAPMVVRYFVTLRNQLSPPSDSSGDLATMRALLQELSGISAELGSVEQSLTVSGFPLAYISARFTGRLYTLPKDVHPKVVEAYASVQGVESVLNEISDARGKLRSTVRAVLTVDPFSKPPLPPESPLWSSLRDSIKTAKAKVAAACWTLMRVAYPTELRELKRDYASMPEGPEKQVAKIFLDMLSGNQPPDTLLGDPPPS
jgi:hypothetical protein